jgi:hypothetical protein
MSQLSLPCASRNVTETQDVDISLMACPKNLANYYISLCAHHQELMKSVGELQLIPALYDEGDSLPLQEQLSLRF